MCKVLWKMDRHASTSAALLMRVISRIDRLHFHMKAEVVSVLAKVPRVDIDIRSASGRQFRGIHQ